MRPAETKLLVLAFEFPPSERVSVQRALRLAKYLPEHGVKPVLVTTDVASLEAWFGRSQEHDLLKELPPHVVIHRVPCPRPPQARTGHAAKWLSHFFSVDENIGRHWEPSLTKIWDQLVAETKPAAIYVTIPPFSMGPLAVKLARRSQLPLIMDFRDNWSQFCSSARPTWLHYQLQLRRERQCVEGGDAVVGVTRQLVLDIQAVHPHVAKGKFHVIPNGYDAPLPMQPAAVSSGRASDPFVIGYVGSFYYTPESRDTVMEPWWRRPPQHWLHYAPRREDWLYRSPFFFFRAMHLMLEHSPELRSRVKVRFVGDSTEWLRRQIAQFGLSDIVEHLGRLPHRECLEFQSRCDALLLTSAKVVGGRDYCIAGKTFEYVVAGRPILGFATEGEQREFLQASGLASICDPDDPLTSAKTIADMIAGKFELNPNFPFLAGFHRRETARKFSELVQVVVDKPSTPRKTA